MPTSRLFFRRLFSIFVFASGLLTLVYISMTTVRAWHVESSTLLRSRHGNVSSSAFVLQSDINVDDSHPPVRETPEVVTEEHLVSGCPGRIKNDDDADWHICQPLITGNTRSKTPPNTTFISATEYTQRTKNCNCFRSDLGYFVSPEDTTDEERRFPIAFSLLTYENLEQTERLLRLIYRPHNIYCIHVDAKSSAEVRNVLDAITACLDNVFIAVPSIDVNWGKVSVVHAELICMRQLLENKRWKYFINLVGRDFPLRTNLELVKILTAYNGSNDVDGTRRLTKHYFPEWFKFSWKEHEVRGPPKEPAPHGFNVAKGSAHMAVTREFVEFAVNDSRAQDLLYWMRDIKVPDEHFFQTLNHNPQMDIPGAFKGNPDSKQSFTRAKHWSFSFNQKCSGEWVRWICNVGVGDLPWVTKSPHMFLNKIRLEQDPAAFRCLELWYRDRVRRRRLLTNRNDTFDVSLYASQPFVRDHV